MRLNWCAVQLSIAYVQRSFWRVTQWSVTPLRGLLSFIGNTPELLWA
jgi:hypothetical protein